MTCESVCVHMTGAVQQYISASSTSITVMLLIILLLQLNMSSSYCSVCPTVPQTAVDLDGKLGCMLLFLVGITERLLQKMLP